MAVLALAHNAERHRGHGVCSTQQQDSQYNQPAITIAQQQQQQPAHEQKRLRNSRGGSGRCGPAPGCPRRCCSPRHAARPARMPGMAHGRSWRPRRRHCTSPSTHGGGQWRAARWRRAAGAAGSLGTGMAQPGGAGMAGRHRARAADVTPRTPATRRKLIGGSKRPIAVAAEPMRASSAAGAGAGVAGGHGARGAHPGPSSAARARHQAMSSLTTSRNWPPKN